MRKIEQYKNIFLFVYPQSAGPFARRALSCAVFLIQPCSFSRSRAWRGWPRRSFVLVMPLDPAPFLHHLDRFNMTEAQKVAFIHRIECLSECLLDWLEADDSAASLLEGLRAGDSDKAAERVESDDTALMALFERVAEERAKIE